MSPSLKEPFVPMPERRSARLVIAVIAALIGVIAALMVTLALVFHSRWGLGPGIQDFNAVLLGPYTLNRTSAHQVYISWKGGLDPTLPGIPKKVLECCVHAPFILAKRQGMRLRSISTEDTYEIPDPAVLDYWILDTRGEGRVLGPLTLDEFLSKRREFGIPDSAVLRDVYTFRK